MARPATGQIVEDHRTDDIGYAMRFRAYGERRFVTLGRASEGWTKARADEELQNTLADVRRGRWIAPKKATPIEAPREEPTFHEFASEWLEARKPELGERTYIDYEWAISYHLLPHFATFRLSEITKRDVDAYKTFKLNEGVLSANTTNKTLTRLAQILELAVEYELIPANPAAGRRRRLKSTKPLRPWVEPEQLPTLLDSADKLLAGRGRPLLAVLAGGGLRIDEALSLERRDVNILKATLAVRRSKTDAGVRTVDLTPALRDEIALWLDRLPGKGATDLVFPTLKGLKDNRQNVRRRLLITAIGRANKKLAELGMEPIGKVSPHGLRRTYASLRCVAGDDVAYTAAQLGHTDPTFTLKTYTHATKRRDRLTGHELAQFNRAVEWAEWAATGSNALVVPATAEVESAA